MLDQPKRIYLVMGGGRGSFFFQERQSIIILYEEYNDQKYICQMEITAYELKPDWWAIRYRLKLRKRIEVIIPIKT